MAAYVTPDDVRAALAPLAAGNDQASAASLSDDQIQAAIDDAGSQVDAALAVRYSLPLTAPVPSVVGSIAKAIAAWLATLTWRRNRLLPPENPVQARYVWATGLLSQLSSGSALLPVPASNASGADVWNTSPDWFLVGPERFMLPWFGPVNPGAEQNEGVTGQAPGGVTVTPPAVPVSGAPLQNPFGAVASVTVQGAIPDVTVDGVALGPVQSFTLPAGGFVTLAYAGPAPLWTWVLYGGDN